MLNYLNLTVIKYNKTKIVSKSSLNYFKNIRIASQITHPKKKIQAISIELPNSQNATNLAIKEEEIIKGMLQVREVEKTDIKYKTIDKTT